MHAIFFIPRENFTSIKTKVESDDVASRQSLTFRDCKTLGIEKDGYYLLVEGSEEGIDAVRKIEGLEEVKGEEAERIFEKIKEQESKAESGFGAIFG